MIGWDDCRAFLVEHSNPDPRAWPEATDRYAHILWILCDCLSVTNVLEIGIGPTSVSGMVFAHSMANRGGGHLLSFDVETRLPEPVYRERAAALGTDWQQVYGDSLVTVPAYQADRAYDLVYVDGDHDFAHAYSDMVHAVAHLRPGGYLLVDDYPGCQGVIEAVQTFEADGFSFVHLSHDPPHGNGRVLWQKPRKAD